MTDHPAAQRQEYPVHTEERQKTMTMRTIPIAAETLSATPDRSSGLSRLEACRCILSAVMQWLSDGFDEEEILQELTSCSQADIYRFARQLELRHGWEADDDLLGILAEARALERGNG